MGPVASVEKQVRSADSVICQNLDSPDVDRGFLSQNVLSQLRNLIEGLVLWTHLNDGTATFHYDQLGPALVSCDQGDGQVQVVEQVP